MRSNRLKLVLIVLLFVAPLLAAWIAVHWWRPAHTSNYGTLLAARQLPPATLVSPAGRATPLAALRGKWVLLVAADSGCRAACRRQLLVMRQVRLMQGADAGRIDRVWLVTDGGAPAARLLAAQAGAVVGGDAEGRLAAALAASGPIDNRMYVVDPYGNLILRYPVPADPAGLSRDLKRLLAASYAG